MHAMDQGPLQHLAAGDERVEVLVADEVVVHAVDLTGTRLTGGGRDRDEQVGMASAQLRDNSALAYRGGAGQNGEAGESRNGGVCGSNVGHGHIMVHRDLPARPCVRVDGLTEALHQRRPLIRPQSAYPPGLGDMHIGKDGVSCCGPHTWQ